MDRFSDAKIVDSWNKNAVPWTIAVENWISLFIESGFNLIKIAEPIHPTTQKPASIIFTAVLGVMR